MPSTMVQECQKLLTGTLRLWEYSSVISIHTVPALKLRGQSYGLSSQVTHRATELDHGSLSTVGETNLLQITLTIWPLTAAKYFANFCPKFLPPQTIAYSNQMAWNTASAHYAVFHAIVGNRYHPTWDLTIVGQTCNVWLLWALIPILKHCWYIFYHSG